MLLHVQADQPQSLVSRDAPGLLSYRVMSRIADYTYAAADGLPGLLMAEFEGPADAVKAALAVTDPDARVNVFRQISPASGWLTADGVQDGGPRAAGTAVLSVVMDVEPHALADFHGWYEEEHLPKLAAVPGILWAQRFAALASGEVPGAMPPDGDRARFLARYEMADERVVTSAAFAEASVLTPRTAAVTAHLSWASQLYRDAAHAS